MATIAILHTANGVARNNAGTYTYEFFLKDHLGNTRIVHNSTGTLLQQTDYYAFGMDIARSQSVPNKYRYNGKEKQDELGQYDYGARFYDPVVGRWHVVDPLAEKWNQYSTYSYTINNPINFVDPDGMDVDDWYETTARGGGKAYKWFEGSGEQAGFKHIGVSTKVVTSRGGEVIGEVALNADGTATNLTSGEAIGEGRVSGTAGGSLIVTKSSVTSLLSGISDAMSGGAVSRMSDALSTYDREGYQSYIYQMMGDAHREIRSDWMSGAYHLGSTGGAVAAKTGTSLVRANRTAGNLFRDELATALRAEGRTVNTEVFKRTPFGPRYMDLDVWYKGVNLGGIETKVGGSRYLPLQRLKDAWLGANGYPVNLVRKPGTW